MSEERSIVLRLLPRFGDESLREIRDQLSDALSDVPLTFSAMSGGGSGGTGTIVSQAVDASAAASGNAVAQTFNSTSGTATVSSESAGAGTGVQATATAAPAGQGQYAQAIYDNRMTTLVLDGLKNAVASLVSRRKDVDQVLDKDIMEEQQKRDRKIEFGMNALNQVGTLIHGGINMTFEVITMIYGKMKEASPMLQAVETMFNIAMQLFFMPLGNKLAEILIPATVELLDKVIDMWDAFDGDSLSDMIEYGMEHGVIILSEYLSTIGGSLAEQGGIVGSIGELMLFVADFIQDDGPWLLSSIVTIADFTVRYLPELVSLLIGFITWYTTYTTTKDVMGIFGYLPGATAIAAVFGLSVGATAGAVSYSIMNNADGGYVPPTEGGQLRRIGEAGEGEYIIPESKTGRLGATTITYNIYGYTDNELRQMIRETVDEQISQARIKGAF